MSAVCVLTPLVVASWPVISTAILGAVASMGFTVEIRPPHERKSKKHQVEAEIENSSVVADELRRGEQIVVRKGDVEIVFGQDARGACTVCVSGEKHSERELRKIGEEVAGRVVQQFAYHKLMTELKKRNYAVVEEQVLADDSVHIRVRL
jgi:hypothetical protein